MKVNLTVRRIAGHYETLLDNTNSLLYHERLSGIYGRLNTGNSCS